MISTIVIEAPADPDVWGSRGKPVEVRRCPATVATALSVEARLPASIQISAKTFAERGWRMKGAFNWQALPLPT